jgi:hypothetical protein
MPRTPVRPWSAAAAAALAVVLVGWTTPARADMIYIIGKASTLDSVSPKSVDLGCPGPPSYEETVIIGAGASVSDATRREHVTGWLPLSPDAIHGGNRAYAYGSEIGAGDGGDWRVSAWAYCGPAPAGLAYVEAVSANDSSASHFAAAVCPGATRVLGTGARISGGGGEVYLSGVVPSPDLTQVVATAHEDGNGYAGAWRVYAYAVCALPIANLQVLEASSVADSSGAKSVEVECPLGTVVHGLGAAITATAGDIAGQPTRGESTAMDILLTYVGSHTHVPGEGNHRLMRVDAVEAAGGTALNWKLWAYAVCAVRRSLPVAI